MNETTTAEQNGPFSPIPAPTATIQDAEKGDSTSSSLTDKSEKKREIVGFKWFVTVASLYITCFLYGLDTTIAAAVQGAVVEDLGHVEELAWIGVGFPLGSVAVIFVMGYLFNNFNMKWMFILTVSLFDIGSALCGAAPSLNALIVGRVIAGAGGTGIYLGTLNYITAMTTPQERGLYTTLIGFSWGVGSVLGPIVGGAFAISAVTWRFAFYLNLIIGAVAAPVYITCLPSIRLVTGLSVKDRLLGIDYAGFILGAGIWASFLLVLTAAGGQWPWDDGRTITTFVVFGALVVLYSLQQYYAWFTTPANRAFPIHLLKERTQVILYVANSAFITALFVCVFYIPIFFQFVQNDSSLTAALRLLPFVVVAIITSITTGHFVGRIPFYALLFVASALVLIAGGTSFVVKLTPDASTSVLYGLSVVMAFGCGLSWQKAYSVAPLRTDPANVGLALSLQNFGEIGGEALALALSGQIYHSVAIRELQSALAGQGFSRSDIIGALAGAESSFFSQLDGQLREAAIAAVSKAIQTTFILVPVSGAVMLLTTLVMRWEKLV
ncbi:MFS general substrate transporter [Xylariaceae sp. FL0255]|nr:MFS general substrate transporter [Xylariaceae sp. FL0255]